MGDVNLSMIGLVLDAQAARAKLQTPAPTQAEIAQVQAEDARLAEARRRPLVQYVITLTGTLYRCERSNAGTKPSHWMIDPPATIALSTFLESVRAAVPAGFRRMDRRKDDRADVVEVWV